MNWINAHYIKKAKPEQITILAIPHLVESYITGPLSDEEMKSLVQFVAVIQDQISYAAQVIDFADIYFKNEIQLEDGDEKNTLLDETAGAVLEMFRTELAALPVVDAALGAANFQGNYKRAEG